MDKEEQSDREDLPFLLALLRTSGLGPVTLARVLKIVASPATIFELSTSALLELGLKAETLKQIREPNWSAVERDLCWLQKEGNFLITASDPYYPGLLKHIHDPPVALFVRGNPEVLNSIQLGIVGSRNPSVDGRRLARDFAKTLASVGFTITSGLALGIDSQSHLGTLDADGKTIAVLGNGLQLIYPLANKALAESVLERGALVSELPLDYGPRPANFPRRNRIISGMSTAVLVVEAAQKSGSLITARCAMEQGRDVFAIPGSIHNPMARGCHSLIREGAKLVERIQDITEEFGPMAVVVDDINKQSTQTQQSIKGLDADAKLLLDSIGYEPVSVDSLVELTGFDVSVISRTLLKLELYGLLDSMPGGSCKRKS